jgi:hypothetical protein
MEMELTHSGKTAIMILAQKEINKRDFMLALAVEHPDLFIQHTENYASIINQYTEMTKAALVEQAVVQIAAPVVVPVVDPIAEFDIDTHITTVTHTPIVKKAKGNQYGTFPMYEFLENVTIYNMYVAFATPVEIASRCNTLHHGGNIVRTATGIITKIHRIKIDLELCDKIDNHNNENPFVPGERNNFRYCELEKEYVTRRILKGDWYDSIAAGCNIIFGSNRNQSSIRNFASVHRLV